MTDREPELGSDKQLFRLSPDADLVIQQRLHFDRMRWKAEQAKVEAQPVVQDPGEEHPERRPVE